MDCSDYALGFVSNLAPGDADDRPAGGGETLISLSVLLEGRDRSVDAAAVSFDDESSIAPHEVGHHRDTIDDEVAVHLRPKPASPEEPQELLLELLARLLVLRIMILDGKSKPSDPSSPLAPLQLLHDLSEIEDPLDFRLTHCIAERPEWLARGNVQQRPSEAGTRNPGDHHPIDGGQRPIPVCGNPVRRAPTTIRGNDVHPVSGVVEDAVEIGGGSMGKNRVGPAGEHSREQMPISG